MKQQLREWIPHHWKMQLKLLQRYFDERKTQYCYSKNYSPDKIGKYEIELHQTIKKSEFHENKIHNLKIVEEKINNLIIKPNEVFSFWKLIGKPSKKNGFKEGRNLIKKNISSDFGGGICQFSSIIYFLALQSGLTILERFNHSIDIYQEHERFTPLGSDCTVVYGYKDLQIQNPYSFPVQLKCLVGIDKLTVSLISSEEIFKTPIDFKYYVTGKEVRVETFSNNRILTKNFYIRL